MNLDPDDLMQFSPPNSPPPGRGICDAPSIPMVPSASDPSQPQLLLDLDSPSPASDSVEPMVNSTAQTGSFDKGATAESMKQSVSSFTGVNQALAQVDQHSSLSSHGMALTTAATSPETFDEPSSDDSELEDNEKKYRLESSPIVPRKTSEKKRLDSALFQSFLCSNPDISSYKSTKPDTIHAKNIENMSAAAIIRKGQSHQILNTPRQYQIELFERAKERNTIVVLDTGSGKTLIAILLLRHIIEQELERRASGEAPKVAFFLVSATNTASWQACSK